jgi:hypothetical protein
MPEKDDKLKPLDLKGVKTYTLASRPSKVKLEDFGKVLSKDSTTKEFLDSLPRVLAVQSLRKLVTRVLKARDLGKPIIWGLGGHVIKTGLAPILIDLMDHQLVSGIAVNGSVLVHDAEIAMVGSTSEDVDATLAEGFFGGAEETGALLNKAAVEGEQAGIGLGEALARTLSASDPAHRADSLLCATFERKVPLTAHLTIGGDIAHFHPSASGAALGATTHTDFRLLAEMVRQMDGGGVYLNIGSAVVLPEVFLKCVTVLRNLGHPLKDITTANFDFIQSYRPLTNVVRRPTDNSGDSEGFAITGHHELTIPLFAAMLKLSAAG